MYWYEFLYRLIGSYDSVEPERLISLEKKATSWYMDLKEKISKDKNAITNKLLLKFINIAEEWWFQTILALCYVFAVKWVATVLNSIGKEDKDDE